MRRSNKISRFEVGTIRKVQKSGRRLHVIGFKVYLDQNIAIKFNLFQNMVNKGLFVETDRRNHYKLTELALGELEKSD